MVGAAYNTAFLYVRTGLIQNRGTVKLLGYSNREFLKSWDGYMYCEK